MHLLTVGNSNTGKSNLNKKLAQDASDKKQNVVVYDPLESQGWPPLAKKFSSPEKFLDYVESTQSAHVFVDEAKSLWDFDQKRADALLYRRRHQGLLIYLIAQRTRMVPPNARNQCSRVFAFRQQKDDADTLADEYAVGMVHCAKAQPGEFLVSDGFNVFPGSLDYSSFPPNIKLDKSQNL